MSSPQSGTHAAWVTRKSEPAPPLPPPPPPPPPGPAVTAASQRRAVMNYENVRHRHVPPSVLHARTVCCATTPVASPQPQVHSRATLLLLLSSLTLQHTVGRFTGPPLHGAGQPRIPGGTTPLCFREYSLYYTTAFSARRKSSDDISLSSLYDPRETVNYQICSKQARLHILITFSSRQHSSNGVQISQKGHNVEYQGSTKQRGKGVSCPVLGRLKRKLAACTLRSAPGNTRPVSQLRGGWQRPNSTYT